MIPCRLQGDWEMGFVCASKKIKTSLCHSASSKTHPTVAFIKFIKEIG